MVAAFREARRLLREGLRPPCLFREIGRLISFAGLMRKNLVQMLDQIGVADRLGLDTTTELFGDASHQLHSTSALRYPVLIDRSNYHGSPTIGRSPLLTEIVSINLPYELKQLPNALIVPLGKAVEDALTLIGFDESPRLLKGFPHPSGANGHRTKRFRSEYQRLRSAVRTWIPLAAGS